MKLISAILVIVYLVMPLISFTQPNALPKTRHSFIVVAHRGDHTAAPENTLAAYQNAINNEVDFVEIDLRTTKDSQLVVMHDASLTKMTGVNMLVKDITLDSLRNLKVRDAMHTEWGFHNVPTFTEVLQLCKGKIGIYLDFKNASVAIAYQYILAARMEKEIVVYINAPQQFSDWRKVAPKMPLMISLPKTVTTTAQMDSVLLKYPVDILDGNYSEYNAVTVAAAKQKGIQIWADIQGINEANNWEKALLLGLVGLQTDHPKALIEFLKAKALR